MDEQIRQKLQNRYAGDMRDSQRKRLVVMAALAAVALGGFTYIRSRVVQPPVIRLDGIIVTFKPAAQTRDIYIVASAVDGKIFVIDPLSHTAAIDIPRQQNAHDILDLIRYVERFPSVESAIPATNYRPID